MERQRYPIGIETFSQIRENGYVYVDKTEYIKRLVSGCGYVFLSRPRRFGKSLLLSTIRSFFEGRRDLFEGLAIADYDWDWTPHPVFHLNFVGMTPSKEGLVSLLERHIREWEEVYGKDIFIDYLPERFYNVIRSAAEKTGKPVVILIDEYDKPIISARNDKSLYEEFRTILTPIYATLKASDEYIKFGMVTGVLPLYNLVDLTDLWIFLDMSSHYRYAGICGFTEEDMLENFMDGFNQFAVKKKLSCDQVGIKFREYYAGYRFTDKDPYVYNPWSVLNAFEDNKCRRYWYATGNPKAIIKEVRDSGKILSDLLNCQEKEYWMQDFFFYGQGVEGRLFQGGYLTIKNFDKNDSLYTIGLPNREVAEGFLEDSLQVYTEGERNAIDVVELSDLIKRGELEKFLEGLKAFLAGIPYYLSKNKPEVYFENNIYIIFKLMGFNVETEYSTSEGRIDLLVKTPEYIYFIELKLNGTAQEAIDQIEERGYVDQFATDPRKLYKIGISFSHKTRNIDEWIIR